MDVMELTSNINYAELYKGMSYDHLKFVEADILRTLNTLPLSVALTDPAYVAKLKAQLDAVNELMRDCPETSWLRKVVTR